VVLDPDRVLFQPLVDVEVEMIVVMVGVALINQVVKLLPTGLEPRPKERSPEGVLNLVADRLQRLALTVPVKSRDFR